LSFFFPTFFFFETATSFFFSNHESVGFLFVQGAGDGQTAGKLDRVVDEEHDNGEQANLRGSVFWINK